MKVSKSITRTLRSGLLLAALLAGPFQAAPAGEAVTDVVDKLQNTDWTSGWRRLNGNWSEEGNTMTPSQGSLSPTAGLVFWSGGNGGDSAENRGIARYFSGEVLKEGTYTATFDVGCFDGLPFADNFTIVLLADADGDGEYSWNDRVEAGALTIVENTPPAAGEWKSWTCTFAVTAATRNAAGEPVVGAHLGFVIVSKVAGGSGYAFDNLAISYSSEK